jgi:hypothetical protein
VQIQERGKQEATSSRPCGQRSLWNLIWKSNVPPKVKVFGWKLASNTIGVQVHRCKRNMEVMSTCPLCARKPERAHHVVAACTKSTALRQCIREVYTVEDWVLVLPKLMHRKHEIKVALPLVALLALERRCDFGAGKCCIEQSAFCIQSYLSYFMQVLRLTTRRKK